MQKDLQANLQSDLQTDLQINISTEDLAKRFLMASEEIQKFIPSNRFVVNAETAYGSCTTGATRLIPAAIRVQDENEIKNIVAIAQQFQLAIYPVSTGRNWGYGTANPVQDGSIILDLSLLNKIISFDERLATVRVQPGVTQAHLYQFMKDNNFEFLVPTTGAGPHTSLMGNLLERGYGITPNTDHFGALVSLKAILPTGEIYQSTLSDAGCDDINNNFKWGLGPYMDGLFAQSNLGIVTECTITLARKPETIEAFIFTLKSEADITKATEALRILSQSLPGILGGMNLMNSRRMLAMQCKYPKSDVIDGAILSDEQLIYLRKENQVEVWSGIGGIYGTKEIVKAAKIKIKRELSPFAKNVKFVSPKTAHTVKQLAQIVPDLIGGKKVKILSKRLHQLFDVMMGIPTEAALPLAYWMTDKEYQPGQNTNIAQDGCGLIWYSPLVVNRPENIEKYIQFIESTCAAHGIEPLITFTTVNDRCFDSTVPLLFNRKNKEATERARACYQELLSNGQALGYFPYRLGIDQMKEVTSQSDSVSWNMAAKIKKALDPNLILSPGRYCPDKAK